jgi:ankyrin repeat protein
VARLLLDQEADINANTSDGWTALMLAVDAGHPKIVRLLLEKGAEVNAKTARGTSALKMAQDKGYKEIEDMLKAHGAKETPGSEDANQSGRPVK